MKAFEVGSFSQIILGGLDVPTGSSKEGHGRSWSERRPCDDRSGDRPKLLSWLWEGGERSLEPRNARNVT